jgi:hypothetical protein
MAVSSTFNSSVKRYTRYLSAKGGINSIDGLTPERAVPNAKFLAANGVTRDGNYWIKFPDDSVHEVYCLMSSGGGGWMNLNTTFGPYTNAVFNASTGAGSRNMIGSVTGTARDVFVGPYVTHNQSVECGNCSGANCPSRVQLNSTLISQMGITEVRMQGRVSSVGQAACPYFAVPSVAVNVAETIYTACGGTYSMGFIDTYGPRVNDFIVYGWIACGNPASLTARIEGMYVR